ncbi:recombinase zinc beta ribbon domain-containing protein, partial [Cereibacter sphaeroides]|uniref:recombinase zinc beta ribbon domain-containing protein n=1 Tax=Cereibacter sphaeroides TaxID=1063 RepID=UPI0039903B0B
RNRRRWGAGDVHRVLTDTVYIGEYVFNRNADECRQVVVPVPAIVDAARFSQVRALLRERNPKRSPPRTTSGPTLLAGLIKCGCCGASMIIQTGKGGRYRYYGCGRVAREGKSGCNGMRARMDEIDSSLRSAVASELFHPDRVEKILGAVIARRNAAADGLDEQAERLRHRLREAEARLKRLWDAIECGLTTPSDRQCQDRIRAANACREIAQNELQKALDLQRGSAVMGTQIAGDFAEILRDKFLQRESGFARLYLRSVIERVIVGNETIQIDWRHEAEPNIAFRLRNGTACVAPPLILRRVNKP